MNSTGKLGSLVFLKLGGSLITDKAKAKTARIDVLSRLADEIAQSFRDRPDLQLLLGHGSGSFGHVPAKEYNTRGGAATTREWDGFIKVWREAAALNHLVMEALHSAGLPAIALPASAGLTADNRKVANWDIHPLRQALAAGLLPVIYGDVVFDLGQGGTIFSTEDLFVYLAKILKPSTILLAGIEEGVWSDFPTCTQFIDRITPSTFLGYTPKLGGSVVTDVTGGMASKVEEMVRLVEKLPELRVHIFSGTNPGYIRRALSGEKIGTLIDAGE